MAVTEFKNLRAVARYLAEEGWQVTERTVYNHGKRGLIRPNKDTGIYEIKAVNRYAVTHLPLMETKEKLGAEDLSRKKTMAEVAKLTEQAKLAQIKRFAEEGKYIPREDLEMELAARAAILENSLKYMVQSKAAEWIEAVEGNTTLRAELIRVMNEDVDRMLNEFASTREFHVIFEKNE